MKKGDFGCLCGHCYTCRKREIRQRHEQKKKALGLSIKDPMPKELDGRLKHANV